MSSANVKIKHYWERGGRALTMQEVEDTLNKHPWIRPPQNVIILEDADVQVPHEGTAVGLNPSWESTIILSATADQETVTHETIHQGLGLGEAGTRLLTPAFTLREKFPHLIRRQVNYKECRECEKHPDLFESYGLRYDETQGSYPRLKHFTLEGR